MSKIRIAFFDIDGTLLDFGSREPSPRMNETLRRLKENGIILCIATGRAPLSLPSFALTGFDAYLTFNGSLCYSGDTEILSNPLPADDIMRIMRNAAGIGRPISIATRNRFIANGMDDDLKAYYGISGSRIIIAEDFGTIISEEKVFQIMMGCYPREYQAVMEGVRHARIAAWWDRAVDIIPADGGKGASITRMLGYFGLDASEAIAFGDGGNDVEMLGFAKIGVAMGNALDNVKKAADYVTSDVDDDGILNALKHFNVL